MLNHKQMADNLHFHVKEFSIRPAIKSELIAHHPPFDLHHCTNLKATMAETQTATPAHPTSIDRVGKIPIVNDTLVSLNSILSQNAYSKGLYSTAQAYGERAYNLSQPVQVCGSNLLM